ncbi:acyltransferase [Marinobacter santoriniensis NKSG1]|uniref:Acyltransferase n=1 Tax=Marinobacter santoriniensis NKSG1 TaxID=1288826 RepID=M7CTS2_9GAMM|nr:acyltransferase family protein [Marinobacter santoriniensis]EMP55575.1 acyltransferase [Marinobacter santoriniensis NKSG1]
MAHRLNYIPQLDGLRAISVLLVILFHSERDWLPGGFVGVDVFFLLSGFLITQIIFKSLKDGSYSYLSFIGGRIRRLFPAYLFMVAGCLVIAPFILLPKEFEGLAASALSSLTFLSNIFFYNNLGYFDTSAEQQLLLHTWSLAVEWQFYFLFPVFLWASFKLTGRIIPLLILLFVLSLVFCVVFTPQNPQFTFFMFPSRAWELVLGGILGMVYARHQLRFRMGVLFSLIGFLLLGYSVVFFNENTVFPGSAAIIPIAGAALIVGNSVFEPQGLVARLLGNRFLVLIGRMSYSLYLWHWPILVYARFYLGDELSLAQLGFCWFLTFSLSYLSWRFVESGLKGHPILTGEFKPYVFAVLATFPLAACAGLVMVNDGFGQRVPGKAMQFVEFNKWPDFGDCQTDYRKDQYYSCRLGSGKQPEEWLVWGDSHAQTLIWGIGALANERSLAVHQITKGGCPPIFFGVPIKSNIDKEACVQSQHAVWDYINSHPSIHTVFMSARWHFYRHSVLANADANADGEDGFDRALRETVRLLIEKGLRVVVVDSLPEPGFDVAKVLARDEMLSKTSEVAFDDALPPMQSLPSISDLVGKGLAVISFNEILCPDGICSVRQDDRMLYFDEDHLAKSGVEKIRSCLESVFVSSKESWSRLESTESRSCQVQTSQTQ